MVRFDAVPPAPAGDLPGIPGFEVLSLLGRGGMGVVYKARQLDPDRLVAVKMIIAGRGASAAALARFRIEAEAIACLDHPNIVRIHKIAAHDGFPYFALEYADGGSLAEWSPGPERSPRRAAEIVQNLARAMQMAHDRGILHRDLKPANVLMTADGTPKITDFGLAKFERPMQDVRRQYATVTPDSFPAGDSPDIHSAATTALVDDETILQHWRHTMHRPAGDSQLTIVRQYVSEVCQQAQASPSDPQFLLAELTRAGDIMGSPQYMAPEQASGLQHRFGPPTDVYGLGGVLYYLCSGRPPFIGATPWDLVQKVRAEQPAPLGSQVNRDLRAICLRCLEKDPAARYQAAAELADDLQRFLDGYVPLAVAAAKTPQAEDRRAACEHETSPAISDPGRRMSEGPPDSNAAANQTSRISPRKRAAAGAAAGIGLIALMFGMSTFSSQTTRGPDSYLPFVWLAGVCGVLGAIAGLLTEDEGDRDS